MTTILHAQNSIFARGLKCRDHRVMQTFPQISRSGFWSARPTLVAPVQPGPWTIGMLARHLWSFAGASDRSNGNKTVLQPFINYKLDQGWCLSSSPVMAANREAKSSNRWTVPVGGVASEGYSRSASHPNIRVEAYGNVEVPEGGPDWATKFTFQLPFPPKN